MKEEKNSAWERIDAITKWAGMSVNQFAQHIGLSRAENLYQIKRGNNGISRQLSERINRSFPEIDVLWILTGRGEMIGSSKSPESGIKYYNLNAEGIAQVDLEQCDSFKYIDIGIEASDCFAMTYISDAMGSRIPTNTTIVLRPTQAERIIPGYDYLFVSTHLTVVRTLHAIESDVFHLRADINGGYGDMTIERGEVESIYKVVAKIIVCE